MKFSIEPSTGICVIVALSSEMLTPKYTSLRSGEVRIGLCSRNLGISKSINTYIRAISHLALDNENNKKIDNKNTNVWICLEQEVVLCMKKSAQQSKQKIVTVELFWSLS